MRGGSTSHLCLDHQYSLRHLKKMERFECIAKNGTADEIYSAIESVANSTEKFAYETLIPPLRILFDGARERGLDVQSPDLGEFMRIILEEGEENDPTDVVRIHSLLLAGMSPNIVTQRRECLRHGEVVREASEPLPLLVAAIKYRMFGLVDHIFNNPNLVVTPDMLSYVNAWFEPIDRIRETMISRINPGSEISDLPNPEEGSRKRSRYELNR
jgi:hypothetical protein